MVNVMNEKPILTSVKKRRISQRKKILALLIFSLAVFAGLLILGSLFSKQAVTGHMLERSIPPSLQHLFGTDWQGRDMIARTVRGLSISILIGLASSSLSAVIALLLVSLTVIFGKKGDSFVNFLVDTIMGLPHILLLILICVAVGKGTFGVMFAVVVTHWPSLTRLLRSEVLQLKEENYVQISSKLGHSRLEVAMKHMLPHILPQVFVGIVLLFPHAILHEASITFLGFGLPPEQPGIGVILSESMKYITTGKWWLAVFPGVGLLLLVVLFDVLGDCIKKMIDPNSAQQ